MGEFLRRPKPFVRFVLSGGILTNLIVGGLPGYLLAGILTVWGGWCEWQMRGIKKSDDGR
jgi:hypothetical protein